MAGKSSKENRSSKTAHVLNLLSGAPSQEHPPQAAPEQPTPSPESREPAAETAPPPPPEPSLSQPSARRLSPPILEVARSNNEALSEQIRQALERSLEDDLGELPQEEATPDPSIQAEEDGPSPLEPEPDLEADKIFPQNPAPAAESPASPSEGASSPQSPVQPPENVPAAPPQEAASPGLQPGMEALNVMELLVDEKLERYVKLFGLCHCPRCLADTKALALTRLPAKYVVLSSSVKPPRLSLYRSRYDSEVTTQIIYACKSVLDSPRHTPEDLGQQPSSEN